MTLYEHPQLHEPGFVKSATVVTSVRVREWYADDLVIVFNRGQNAGSFTVKPGDGDVIARLLIPGATVTEVTG